MPTRYTLAYSRFIDRLLEVQILLRAARKAQSPSGKQPPTPQSFALTNALCRGGVVLLSSHIEGYIEDLAEIVIDQIGTRELPKSTFGPGFRFYFSRDIINELRQAPDGDKTVRRIDRLMKRDGHLWDTTPQFTSALRASNFVASFDNPNHKRICNFFGRFGYTNLDHDLAIRLKANHVVCTNMIDLVIDQRNRIAHGDSTLLVAPQDLEGMVRLVKDYCREVDRSLGDWFKKKGCPIR